MRVLWFTGSPSLAGKHLGNKNVGRGWVESLEAKLTETKEIQLGIAFPWDESNAEMFTFNKTSYYPITRKKTRNKLKKVYDRWLHKRIAEDNVPKYLEIIEKFAPDIIHIFGTENDFGLLVSKTSIPCVIHIQGILASVNNKWYNGFTKAEVFKYSKKWELLKGHGLFHDYFSSKKETEREQKIFEQANHFLGRTDWDKRITSVLSPQATYFHCDEIMREKFYLNKWHHYSTQNNFAIISTIRKNIYKGLETIYESKKIISKIFPQYNITWKVAGTSETDEIAYLIERKYKNKFKNIGIQLLGSLDENSLIDEMLKSDLFINPSHIENSSNSICEAMLLGMPIIATYVGGTPSIVEDKKEGLLIQDGDPFVLSGSIAQIIKNKDYALFLGNNARQKALTRHDPIKIVNDLFAIYSSIISKK